MFEEDRVGTLDSTVVVPLLVGRSWGLARFQLNNVLCMKVSLKSQARAKAGFTLVELVITITIVGLLVAIGIPNYMRARDNSCLNLIYSNLRQIENAKSQWAVDNHKKTGDDVTDMAQLSGYLRGGTVHDAIRETYVPNPVGTPAEANLPVGVTLGTYAAGAAIPAP